MPQCTPTQHNNKKKKNYKMTRLLGEVSQNAYQNLPKIYLLKPPYLPKIYCFTMLTLGITEGKKTLKF
jgi:uncharacterized pyridoxamine 5'-phosphate oxidase family protein